MQPILKGRRLRDRITITGPARAGALDEYGESTVDTSAAVLTRWAQVTERTGKEVLEAGAVNAMGSATFRVWHDSETAAINEAWVISYRGEAWNITSYMHFQKRAMIEMTASRGVAV